MKESQKYAIVDIETTGHSPAGGDRMIQIAIVIMQGWEIVKNILHLLIRENRFRYLYRI